MDSSTNPPHSSTPQPPRTRLRLDAACIADHRQHHAPGTLILEQSEAGQVVLYSGPPSDVPSQLLKVDQQRSYANSTLVPPFVNAHTHLDLTALGPQPYDPLSQGFADWLKMIRLGRPSTDDAIRAAVDRGIQLSVAGGVVAVGDIAGYPNRFSLEPFRAMQTAGMLGVSFLEFFAIGSMQMGRLEELERVLIDHAAGLDGPLGPGCPRLGLQPHAPYTVSLEAYERFVELVPACVPRSTHLAETAAEHEFIARGTGPHREFLESLGLMTQSLLGSIGHGKSPVEHVSPVLGSQKAQPWLLAHCNDISDEDLRSLAGAEVSVAFCPRAHKYFGHGASLGVHRWREMVEAGINVCLATDSIVNLDTPNRISPLDDARLVYQQGLAADSPPDPAQLLAMITVNPAKALGLNPSGFEFASDSSSLDVVEVPGCDSLSGVLNASAAPRLLRL